MSKKQNLINIVYLGSGKIKFSITGAFVVRALKKVTSLTKTKVDDLIVERLVGNLATRNIVSATVDLGSFIGGILPHKNLPSAEVKALQKVQKSVTKLVAVPKLDTVSKK